MITVLAGGTGSVKLVRALAALEEDIAVICNVGDNIWIYGLYICPDIDTIIYGLANLLDTKRGWGMKGDSFQCLAQLRKMGLPTWFRLGDRDLSTHLVRTSMIKSGKSLSEITDFFRKQYSINIKLIPVTDTEITTRIVTDRIGDIHLQEFWVKYKGRPKVTNVRYDGADNATANPAAINAISKSQAVVIAPANPISSIGPILALANLRKELALNRYKVIAISPLIGGKAVSGPAVKYMRALGLKNSSLGVAIYYRDFVSRFLISKQDHRLAPKIQALGMQVNETNTLMKAKRDEVRLGRLLLKLIEK
ncbi:MAG: 2-phospho-L-lactate transferase [Thermoproteota archaeon]|nr:2-phospho-L-lactate transferase [Thermoproteota archaeon]